MIKNKNGFTLLEVLIVIVILGIVGILASPHFIDLMNGAKQKTEESIVGAVKTGIHAYYQQSIIQKRTPLYPAVLDDASDGSVSNTNQFFTNVLSISGIADWQKSGFLYTGPTAAVYTYDPIKGTFTKQNPSTPVVEALLGLAYDLGRVGGTGSVAGLGDNQGQIVGDVQVVDGKVGQALHFDGLGSHIAVPDSPPLDLTTAGTLAAWIYVDSIPPFAGIIHKGDMANFSDEAYSLQFWTNNKLMLFVNPTGTPNYTQGAYLLSNTTVAPNQWYYVVGTWDSSGMNVYVNGELDSSNTTVAVAQNSSGGLNIGSQTSQNYNSSWINLPFHGAINEAQVFDRALTADQVKAYYDSVK